MSKDIQSYFTVVSEDEHVKKEERERRLKEEIITSNSKDESAKTKVFETSKSGTNSVSPIKESNKEDIVVATTLKQKTMRKKRLKWEIFSSDSNEEDDVIEIPQLKENKREKRLKWEIFSSDSEDESTKTDDSQKVTNIKPKLKLGNVLTNIFKISPIKQRKVKVLKAPDVKPVENVEIQTLENLEFQICIQNIDRANKAFEEDMRNELKTQNMSK